MLLTALRPMQKSASRMLLAGTNAAVDLHEHGAEPWATEAVPAAVGHLPTSAHGEPCPLAPPTQRPLPLGQQPQPMAGALPLWHMNGRWPGAESWPGAAPDFQTGGAAASVGVEASQAQAMAFPTHLGLWHLDTRWPVGTMVWPVFMPVQAVACKGMEECQLQLQHMPTLEGPAGGAAALAAIGAAPCLAGDQGLPVRTGASRRQRRRQRASGVAAPQDLASVPPACLEWLPPASSIGSAVGAAQQLAARAQWSNVSTSDTSAGGSVAGDSDLPAATEGATVDGPSEPEWPAGAEGPELMLWPPTPESTPPSSPRMSAAEFSASPLPLPNGLGQSYEPTSSPEMAGIAGDAWERLVSGLDEGAVGRAELLDWVVGLAWPMASSPGGCRVVQKALEVAAGPERAALAEQLRGHVWEASSSPHANHVLQKCIEVMSPDRIQFVLEEMKGHAVAAARHRYGCRVLERLIEFCPASQTAGLVDEVLSGAPQLCRHTFGNFVVQHILEHGTPEQRHLLADVVHSDIQRLARHRVASHVVRSALVHCSPEDRERLVQAMRADAGELADLAHHHCGSFVVREMRRGEGLRR